MTARGQQLAITLTCLVAAVSYAGAVTTSALALYVLPGTAGAALVASLLVARRMPAMALLVGGLLALGWSELVNIWSGTTEGPAARSTFFAAGWSLIAIVAAQSRWPALFLGGVAGVVTSAVVLGAGGEVRMVAVAAAASAALTLGWIERSHRNWTAPPRRSAALILLSLLAAAAAVATTQAQQSASSSTPPNNRPHTHRTNPPPHTRLHGPTPQTAHATRPHHAPAPKHTDQSWIWLYVLAAVLALILLVAARLLATRLAWRRVRQGLAAGAPDEQVTGAWAWTRMRLEACRLPLAVDVSPDSVAAGRLVGNLPTDVFTPLRELATATTTAAFAYEQSITGAVIPSWAAAGRVEASARELLTRSGRACLAFRGPPSAVLPENEATPRADGQRKVVIAGRSLTTTQAAIIAASGLVLCFAILAGFGVFSSGEGAVPTVSIPTKPATAAASTSTPTVRTPTTPRHALASAAQAPSQTLAPGDTGPQVKILQRALAVLGFSAGTPDGDYGRATQTAVERFQASKGLAQFGVVGPQTLAALQHALSRRSRR